MASMKREWNRSHGVKTSTGSANAYVVTYDTAPAALANGQQHSFVASFANTATATANINSLGAKTIKKHGGAGLTALSSGDIQIGHHVHLEYDLSADVYVLLTPTATAAGTGTIASQNSDNVSITGGTITGITDLAVADGGTGRSTLAAHGTLIGNGTGGVTVGSPGTAGQVWMSNGAAADPTMQTLSVGAGVTYSNYVLLTASSGTWSVPAGVTQVLAILQAGGGAGGGVATSGGGNPSAFASSGSPGANIAANVAVSGSVSYTIGAGGTAGSSGSNPGNAGGDTTFGTITAKGGLGGLGASQASTGVTSAASPGQPQAPGLIPVSSTSIISATLIPGTAGSASSGATGPNSPLGVGGAGNSVGNGSAPASGYGGAGGGGGISATSGPSQHGGAGAIGCIVIFY